MGQTFDSMSPEAAIVALVGDPKAPVTHCAYDCPMHGSPTEPMQRPSFGEAYLSACGEPTTFELTGPPCPKCLKHDGSDAEPGACWQCARK